MDLHKPKPWHGVREFLKEYVIIVVGVLTALGGEQVVETLRTNRDVAEARHAIDAEAGFDIGVYQSRLERGACIERRLADLEHWAGAWRAHRPIRLTARIGRPRHWTMQTTVWTTATGGVVARMPFDERTEYATLYDRFRNYEDIRTDEIRAWAALAEFDDVESLDPASLMRLRGLITQLEVLNDRVKSNVPYVMPLAEKLHIKAAQGIAPSTPGDLDFCRSILPDAAAS